VTGAPPTGVPLETLLAAVTRRLERAGARHPAVAAALLVARGRRALDQPAFADLAGVPVAHLRSLESGSRPPSHAPRRLAEIDDALDWSAAGLLGRDDPADAAARHPAAWCARPGSGARIRPWTTCASSTG
jgi:hypothetical protein